MKAIYIGLFNFLAVFNLFAQQITFSDQLTSVGKLGDVAVLPDSSFITTMNDGTTPSTYSYIKYSKQGDTLWTRNYNEVMQPITMVSDGNLVSATSSFKLYKINQNGDTLWTRQPMIPNFNLGVCDQIIPTSDGNFVFIGWYFDVFSNTRVAIGKYDLSGTQQWLKSYALHRTADILELPTGGYIVSSGGTAGYLCKLSENGDSLTSNHFSTIAAHRLEYNLDSSQLYLTGYDAATKVFTVDTALADTIQTIFQDPSMVATEIVRNDENDLILLAHESAGTGKILISKIDLLGNKIWERGYQFGFVGVGDFKLRKTLDGGYIFAGAYDFDFFLGSGYFGTLVLKVNERGLLFNSDLVTANISCNGQSDGQISAAAVGSTTSYNYLWNNPSSSTTKSISGLIAGTYNVTITGPYGSHLEDSSTVVDPVVLSVTLSSTDALCNGSSDGTAQIIGAGGTTPYSYMWGIGSTVATLTGLAPNAYGVTLTDGGGCQENGSVTVSEPAAIQLVASKTDPTCSGFSDGTANVSVTGGVSTYTYLWSNQETSTTISGLQDGVYNVTVFSTNNCMEVASLTISAPSAISVTLSGTNPSCFGASNGAVSSSSQGGVSSYTYSWSNTSATSSIQGLSSGDYTLTVTDGNSCNRIVSTTLTDPTQILTTISTAICQGDSLLLESAYQTTAGVYYDTLSSASSCDSIIETTLAINDPNINVISGSVIFDGNPINTGEVNLYEKTNVGIGYTKSDSIQVDVNGTYSFTQVGQGEYIINALGDTSLYDNISTYSDNTSHWDRAIEYDLTGGCSDTISNANVNLTEKVINNGSGTITGQLNKKGTNEPVSGIGISLEAIPGGVITDIHITDSNGEFSFISVPNGEYYLWADIIGYGVDTVSTVTISDATPKYNIVLCVDEDSAIVDVCQKDVVNGLNGINEETESLISIYPNPTNDVLNFEYHPNKAFISMQILDVSGRLVYQTTNQELYLDVSGFDIGVYQVKVSYEGQNISEYFVRK